MPRARAGLARLADVPGRGDRPLRLALPRDERLAAPDASDSNGHASDNPPIIVDPIGQFDPHADCRFEITAEGNVTVRKFGNSAERLITGQLF